MSDVSNVPVRREDAPSRGRLSGVHLELIAEHAERRRLARGETLISQGYAPDTMYVVVSGRFHVVLNGHRVIGDIGAGEPIGEVGFFSDEPRTASVVAARDSVVLALTKSAYDTLAVHEPDVPRAILRSLATRLAAATVDHPEMAPKPPRTIALCPAGDAPIPPGIVAQLGTALDHLDPTRTLTHRDLPPGLDAVDEDAIAEWLFCEEAAAGRLLLVADDPARAWDRVVLRQSDGLVLVAPLEGGAGGDSVPLSSLELYATEAVRPPQRTLVLWREPDAEIRNTARWLDARPVNLHHHVAMGQAGDIARLARFLNGTALGLVLAGGGALACSHLGVFRAFAEDGVEVDMIGGTSAGAAFAIGYAAGHDVDTGMRIIEDVFVRSGALRRYTLPVYSIIDHHAFDETLRRTYGAKDLADLRLNAFAVSTNLSTDEMMVHRRGAVWEAIRASTSIPAVLPPFIDSAGDAFVDGALMDNVPLGTMQALKAGPNVVVALVANRDWHVDATYASLPGRIELMRRLAFRRALPSAPRVADVIARSMMVMSRRLMRETEQNSDLLLVPPMASGIELMDWHLSRQQAAIAYEYTRRMLDEAGGFEALLKNAAGQRVRRPQR